MTELCRRTPYLAMTIYQDAETTNYEAGPNAIATGCTKMKHVAALEHVERTPIASSAAESG